MFPGGAQQYNGLPSGFGQGQGWAQGPAQQAASWSSLPGGAPGPYGSQTPPSYSGPASAYQAGQAAAQQYIAGQAAAPQYVAGQQASAGYASAVGARGQYGGYSNVPQYGYQQQQQQVLPPGRYAPAAIQLPPAPPGIAPDVWQWFVSVDADRSGKITSEELRFALMNGNWTPFNQETCRLMIGMFDRDKSGTIDVYEFCSLWKYIQDWKACFDSFDRDRSGSIDCNELQLAFRSFGYTLSQQFCQLCVRVFDRIRNSSMKFDDFIQCCVMLKSLTDHFRVRDTAQQGVIRVSYEDFLEMVLDVGVGQG